MDGTAEGPSRVGTAGLIATVVAHLVWDPALTLVGVATFGIAEEDAALVRTLLRIHPAAWVATKVVVVGGFAAVVVRMGAHRIPVTAWLLWLVAAVGIVAPLGWLELLASDWG
jgi:hypothetical protein